MADPTIDLPSYQGPAYFSYGFRPFFWMPRFFLAWGNTKGVGSLYLTILPRLSRTLKGSGVFI